MRGSQLPKKVVRDPNMVPLDEIQERAMVELSAAFSR